MKKFLLITLVFAMYLLTGVAQVGPDERAIVRRFGEVVARPGPGLWIGLPYGIDQVDRVQIRTVRQLVVGYLPEEFNDAPITPPGQFLTGDQNLVNTKLVIEYAIDDRDEQLDQFVINQNQVPVVLTRETEVLASEWASGRKVEDVLSGRVSLSRWISDRLPQRLAPHQLGIVVQRVSVEYLAAPEEVKDAFEAVNQAQTTAVTRQNQAQQQAAGLRNDAESLRLRLESEALAYREERFKMATADAQSFLARYEQYQRLRTTNPDFLGAIWREEIGKILVLLKVKGRIEILDDFLGPNGLELNQFIPVKSR